MFRLTADFHKALKFVDFIAENQMFLKQEKPHI